MSPSEEALLAAVAAELKGLTRRFDEYAVRTEESLMEIGSEVKKTNGRVTALERINTEEASQAKGRREGISWFTRWTSHPLVVAVVAAAISGALAILLAH